MSKVSKAKQVREKLRQLALELPEATEDFPWGERVVKVNKKVFAFFGRDMDSHFGFGVKLKASHAQALSEPFASPMRYGLGKSGWVSAKFEADVAPSFAMLKIWLLESYGAVAPKSLGKQITPSAGTRPTRKTKTTRKTTSSRSPSSTASRKSKADKAGARARKPTRAEHGHGPGRPAKRASK